MGPVISVPHREVPRLPGAFLLTGHRSLTGGEANESPGFSKPVRRGHAGPDDEIIQRRSWPGVSRRSGSDDDDQALAPANDVNHSWPPRSDAGYRAWLNAARKTPSNGF